MPYNAQAVDAAIAAQNRSGRGKIRGREARAIHALLKGWRGDMAERAAKS